MNRLLSFFIALLFSTAVYAQQPYRLIVPQEPGGGTSVWANIIAQHLEKFIGTKVIVEHIPGANDIPGFNKFHNELQKDPYAIMVAHGGNAESFLTDKVDYDYKFYEPIGLVNLNIVVSHATNFDPYKDKVKFGSTSGRRPDVMAIVMMICGPQPNMDAYIKCYNDKMIFVKGMKPAEARLAALRGELNTVRETYSSHLKFIGPMIEKGDYKLWFSHGVLDLKTGKIIKDKNYNTNHFEDLYKQKWGVAPSGEFYDAYVLVKNFRDVLQKSLWVGKSNPNAEHIRASIRKMLADPAAKKALDDDSGDYEWFIGDDMTKAYNIITKQITEKNLKNLVMFTQDGIKLESVYKPELIAP